jgi:hypothetical protein
MSQLGFDGLSQTREEKAAFAFRSTVRCCGISLLLKRCAIPRVAL